MAKKQNPIWGWHKKVLEQNSLVLTVGVLAVVSIGGLVEIAPLFYLDETIEEVEGVRPYSPLALMGRDIYIREGCYNCHSQMVRPLRDEVERYGHYSLAAESMYDHPFQWGSKRTGPDLARIGGRYTDEWHRAHLVNPRDVVPQSNMPGFPWLADNEVDAEQVVTRMRVQKDWLNVPYTDAQVDEAQAKLEGKTEMQAIIAYLQHLGTNFSAQEK